MTIATAMVVALSAEDPAHASDRSKPTAIEVVITPAGAEPAEETKAPSEWSAGIKAKRAVKNWAGALQKVTRQVFGIFGSDRPAEKKAHVPESIAIKQPTAVNNDPLKSDLPRSAPHLPAGQEGQTALATTAPVPLKPSTKITSASCEKAKTTISKYAFTDIEAKSCGDEVLQFAAVRNGEMFSVKVDARSGDLIKVEKLALNAAPAQIEEHPRPY